MLDDVDACPLQAAADQKLFVRAGRRTHTMGFRANSRSVVPGAGQSVNSQDD
jgi:hypothetical protein